MLLFLSITILISTITGHVCKDNVLWKDQFGWTCRDYNRDPRECSSDLAISVGGIDSYEACCACEFSYERRRDYATCLRACAAKEDECQAGCRDDKAVCEGRCNDDYESESGDDATVVTPTPAPDPVTKEGNGGGESNDLEIWVIVLIAAGVLLLVCIICIILYSLCMPRDEGSCEDEECTQQPMLVGGGCDAPCDAPCETQYDRPGEAQMVAYDGAQGYPQGNTW